MGSIASPIITQKPTVASQKIAAVRARDSVRRASDFVQIPITLNEQRSKREMPWLQQLSSKIPYSQPPRPQTLSFRLTTLATESKLAE
jgi:hypothetical protein